MSSSSASYVDDDVPSIRALAGYSCLACDTCHYGASSCPVEQSISVQSVLNAFGVREGFHEWTPLARNRFGLLETYWTQCFATDICPYSHIHPPKSCFCGCPGSRLNMLDSIALRPVSHVRDFYNYLLIEGELVIKDDPKFQQAVADSLFKNRRYFTPLKDTLYVDPTNGKEYRDSFLWILENVLLPTTLRDARFTDDGESEGEDTYTLFHCLFELDSVLYYPEPEKYTRRMIVAFFRAGFDFTTPGCPSLMTAAIRSSNSDLLTALDFFDVPFAADSGDALLYRIRLTVGELCGMAHSTLDDFDKTTDRGRILHNEKLLWAAVANTVYHSAPLIRAFADKEEDDESRKLRLTGLLTAIHPRYSKYTSVEESYYARHYLKDGVDRILLPSAKRIDDLMTLLEALRVAGFDFSAKHSWKPFYGETAPEPLTPRNFYNEYSRVVEVLDPALDAKILAALKP